MHCKTLNKLMKIEGTLVDFYHVIKHLPSMEKEEGIMKLHIPLPVEIPAIPTPVTSESKELDDIYSYNISLTR